MDSDVALALVDEMLWTAIMISAPVLGVALLVGLIVSVLQVVTQIQEMTLTFVPKILAVVFVIFVLGHWMLSTLVYYMRDLFLSIPVMF